MTGVMVVQGRELRAEDIGLIQGLLAEHRDWGRTRLSEELCRLWDWRNAQGRIKDMAARTLLLKLERGGHIRLPERRRPSSNGLRNRHAPLVDHATAPICGALRDLRPLGVSIVESGSEDLRLFNCLLGRYHYLGHRNTVGENIRYLVRDRGTGGLRTVRLGGVEVRGARRLDRMGARRTGGEPGVVDQQHALLVLPWVTVAHLASHLLATLARRICADWQRKYGHPIHALETFVDRERFKGTCYQAANWVRLGSTQGRTRNDRNHRLRASLKDVYLYPLIKDFRRELCAC
jgi:hypothetical protein